ncbi:MAG: segregation/condensation protein A, partial [Pirellulaceae bacterium]
LGRIMRDNQATQPSSIVYDDTPIHVYMEQIHERLLRERRVALSQMLQPGMHKSAMIGIFLAILELVRHHKVHTEQSEPHGEIVVVRGESFVERFHVADVDLVGDEPSAQEEVPSQPR